MLSIVWVGMGVISRCSIGPCYSIMAGSSEFLGCGGIVWCRIAVSTATIGGEMGVASSFTLVWKVGWGCGARIGWLIWWDRVTEGARGRVPVFGDFRDARMLLWCKGMGW